MSNRRPVTRTFALLITLAAPLLVLGGCAYGELKQVLRAQVAAEASCPDVTIEGSPAYQPGYKPGQYRVKGCGVDRLYDCPPETGLVSYNSSICTFKDAKAPPAAAPAAAPEPPPMDEEAPLEEPAAAPAEPAESQ
ncbi:MAG TPA: hypothetical protein VJV78_00010 [Polyangiales bacterium]|nr:hypothetical protein [Polyangiales bacterium]